MPKVLIPSKISEVIVSHADNGSYSRSIPLDEVIDLSYSDIETMKARGYAITTIKDKEHTDE